MKSTGIVRRVDELGRVVIPIELRNKFGIAEKYEPNCVFCGSSKKLMDYKGKLICSKCAKQIADMDTNE